MMFQEASGGVNAALGDAEKHVIELEQAVKDAESRACNFAEESVGLKTQIMELTSAVQGSVNREAEGEEMRRRVLALEEEKEELKRRVLTVEEEREQLKLRVLELEEESEEACSRILTLERQREVLGGRASELERNSDEANRRVLALVEEGEFMKRRVSELEEESGLAKCRVLELTDELGAVCVPSVNDKELSELSGKVTELSEKLTESEGKVERGQKLLALAAEEKSALLEMVGKLQEEQDKVRCVHAVSELCAQQTRTCAHRATKNAFTHARLCACCWDDV